MSKKNLSIILLSGVLTFSAAPSALSQSSQPKTANPAPTQRDKGSKSEQMQKDMANQDSIKQAQQALKTQGLYKGAVDGKSNAEFESALRAYQTQNQIQVTGKLDPQTMAKLGLTSGHKPQPPLTPDPDNPRDNPPVVTPPDQKPKPGEGNASSVEDIRQVQMALKNRGFDPGEINGMISSQTQKAIKDFQTANNLPVSGNLDQRTLTALGVKIKYPDKKPELSLNTSWGALQKVSYQPSLQSKVDDDLVKRIEKSAEVVQALTGAEDKRIPNEMLQRAEGMVVIPNMIKGAFGIGGRYGKGIVAKRLPNGHWSAPAFVSIGGGSFGAQLGVSSTDLVLVFTDKQAFEALAKNLTLKLGADAGVVAGPLGRSGEAGVTHDLKSGIYAYSRSKGLFAGIALDGAVIDMDKDNNREMYGASAAAASILSDASLATNPRVRALVEALDRVAPRKTSK
jgi:SH3 domain-containing YSC84-like protein 1